MYKYPEEVVCFDFSPGPSVIFDQQVIEHSIKVRLEFTFSGIHALFFFWYVAFLHNIQYIFDKFDEVFFSIHHA